MGGRTGGWQVKRYGSYQKWRYAAVWAALILAELLIAAAPAVATAALLIPALIKQRGRLAYGSEWILVTLIFWLVYWMVHELVCDRIFGKEAS